MVVIDGFPMDVALTEEPTFAAELTTFPMEDGVDINDHLHHSPDMLQIECIVSDTPFRAVEIARLLDDKAIGTSDDVLPSDQAYVRLKQIKEAGEPVDVDTSIDFFTSMVMISMTPSRMGDAIKYTCTFQRASFVTNERTQIRVAVPRVAAPKNLGPKAPSPFAGEPIVWCKERRADGSCALSEQLGIDVATQNFVHANGVPLSEDELEDFRASTKQAYDLENLPDESGVRPDGSMTWNVDGQDIVKEPTTTTIPTWSNRR